LGTVATLQFHEAILAEKSNRYAGQLVFLCLICGSIVATLTLTLSFGMSLLLSSNEIFGTLGVWIWLLPVSVMVTALVHSVNFYCNRVGEFRYLAIMPAVMSTTTVSLSLLFGYWQWGANGLLTSYFAGHAIVALGAIWMLVRLKINAGSLKSWRVLFRRHRKFVFFTLPARFVGEFNHQVPIYALGYLGTGVAVGFFTRARTLVTLPISLVARAVGQVYRQKGSEDYRSTNSCRVVFRKTLFGLVLLAAPSIGLLAFFGPALFLLVLGPNWRGAGEIAQILAPMLFLRMITAPLSSTLFFTGNQVLDFYKELGSSLVLILGLFFAVFLSRDAYLVVAVFSITMSAKYLVELAISYRCAEASISSTQ
jgi:O-antigen/teichoic acid export membrane protein